MAASTLESARLMLLSKSSAHPGGIGNSSGHVGHNFCEHVMGPSVLGIYKDLVGKPRTLDDGRPGGFYIPRFRNLKDRHPALHPRLRVRGRQRDGDVPGHGGLDARLRRRPSRRRSARTRAPTCTWAASARCCRDTRATWTSTPQVKDRWGVPVLRFHYAFGDNERKMAADMADTAREMFEAAGVEVLSVDREILTEGWSIHELGTARMGADAKTSVLNGFQQSHDVKNLFVVDGSSHVSASCQNPTWTIMALAWRSCDHLADELKRGNL